MSELEKLIEAGIELHNIVDKEPSMLGYEWACEAWRKALQEFRAAQHSVQADVASCSCELPPSAIPRCGRCGKPFKSQRS